MHGKSLAVVLISVLLVVVIGGFAFLIASGHTPLVASKLAAVTATPDPYGCNMAPQGTQPSGGPAIKPKNTGAIAFDEQDVKDYYAQRLQKISATIDSIQFLTSAQACLSLQGVQIGLMPDVMVCMVRLHGINPVAAGGKPFTETDIFNGHTGNLLVTKIGT